MRVLMLSLDRFVTDPQSLVGKRLSALSHAVGEVVVLVPEVGSKVRVFFTLWRQAKVILSEKNFNLITVQDTAYLAFLGYLLARQFKIPLEIQVHGLEKFFGLRKFFAGFVLRHANKVRVVSQRLKHFLMSRFSLPDSRLYVLPIYTQPEKNREGGILNRKDKPFTFLTVGRLVPVKNIALQIRAFAWLVREFPNARLVIVGNGPEMAYLKLIAIRYTLNASVSFEGHQNDVGRYYAEADAFLLTSNSEGWGLVALEAAAYGLPIIMTDVGLAGEVLKNGESALVIPVGDEEALVQAMKRVITDANLRQRLGEEALRVFTALPNPEEQIQKQVEAWRSLE